MIGNPGGDITDFDSIIFQVLDSCICKDQVIYTEG